MMPAEDLPSTSSCLRASKHLPSHDTNEHFRDVLIIYSAAGRLIECYTISFLQRVSPFRVFATMSIKGMCNRKAEYWTAQILRRCQSINGLGNRGVEGSFPDALNPSRSRKTNLTPVKSERENAVGIVLHALTPLAALRIIESLERFYSSPACRRALSSGP